MNKEKTNYNFINVLKFIFSIFVIASHTKFASNINNEYIRTLVSLLINCAVPFFFLCNGYSLAEKINFYTNDKKQLKRLKVLIIGFIKKYAFWSIVYLPLAFVEYFKTGNFFIYSFFSYLKGFFLKGEHYNSWMLWYLLSLIYVLIFIYICLKKNVKFKNIALCSIAIGSLSLILKYSSIYEISINNIYLNYFVRFIELTLDNGRLLTGFIYIPIGVLLKNHVFNRNYSTILLIISIIIFFLTSDAISALLIVVISIFLFNISLNIKLKDKYSNICNIFRDISNYNYFIHMYVYTIYYYVMYKAPTYSIDCFIFTSIITTFISYLYIWNKNRKISC